MKKNATSISSSLNASCYDSKRHPTNAGRQEARHHEKHNRLILASPPHPILPTTRQQKFFNFYCKNGTCQLLVHVQLFLRGWDNERTSSNTLSAACSQPTLEDVPATTTEPTSQICLPTTNSLTHLTDRLVPLLEARITQNISSHTPVPSTSAVLPSVHTHILCTAWITPA